MIERFVIATIAVVYLLAHQPMATAQSSGQAALDAAYAELAAAQAELAAAQNQHATADKTATNLRGGRGAAHEANWRARQDVLRRINDLEGQQPRNDAAISAALAELEGLIAADAAADQALNNAEGAAVTTAYLVEQAQARVAAAQAQIAALQQNTQSASSAPSQQQQQAPPARPVFAPAPPPLMPTGPRPMLGAAQPQGIYAPAATAPGVPRPPGFYSGARPIPPIAQPSLQRPGWPQRAGVSVVPGTMQRPHSISRPPLPPSARPVTAHHVTPNKPLFYRAPSVQRSHQFTSRPSLASVPRPSAPRYPVPTQRISRNSVLSPSAATRRTSTASSAYRSVSRPAVTTGTMRRR